MKTVQLLLIFSVASIIIVVVGDVFPGKRAEFLNAYSVLQRMLGQAPSGEDSLVAQ